MYMRSLLIIIILLINITLANEYPGLGTPLTEDMISEVDYTILPNGNGLPMGSGTPVEGLKIYDTHCIACHGAKGIDGINGSLVGGLGSLSSNRPIKTVGSYWPYATTIFDYIRRAMPLTAPGSLSNDEVYAVTAYLLYLNQIINDIDEINSNTLPLIKMPNQDGFTWAYD